MDRKGQSVYVVDDNDDDDADDNDDNDYDNDTVVAHTTYTTHT